MGQAMKGERMNDKKYFIKNCLEPLVMAINDSVEKLKPVEANKDITHIDIIFLGGSCLKVNVEGDSLLIITQKVIKKLT